MQDRFRPGMIFTEELLLDAAVVERFAHFSGDRNPVHVEAAVAREYGFARPVAHGAIQTALVSKLIGMKVPGPGAVWMRQSMEWLQPAFVGDVIRVSAEVDSVSEGAGVLDLKLSATNQKGDLVMTGSARVKQSPKVAPDGEGPSAGTRVALVTGGSRGIGAAIAKALAAAGYKVAVTYHSRKADAEAVVEGIIHAGGYAEAFGWDAQAQGGVANLVESVSASLGPVDALIHAATQPLPPTAATDVSAETLQPYMRVHVEAGLELVTALASSMAERGGGRFIFLGTSFLFSQPPVKMMPYIMAKSALHGMVRCLATELGPQRITVNMVSPGMTITELNSQTPQRIKEAEARRVPARRLAVAADTAALVAFLTSPEAAYINGQNLPLTGGPT